MTKNIFDVNSIYQKVMLLRLRLKEHKAAMKFYNAFDDLTPYEISDFYDEVKDTSSPNLMKCFELHEKYLVARHDLDERERGIEENKKRLM